MLRAVTLCRAPRALAARRSGLSAAHVTCFRSLALPQKPKLHFGQKTFSTSSLPPVAPDRDEIAARQQLERGNYAEAYGLHPEAGAIGSSGIWEKWGLSGTVGLGLAALISKEVIIVNEELLLVGCFSGFFLTLYIVFSDPAMKAMNEAHEANRKEVFGSWDERLDAWRNMLCILTDNTQLREEMAKLKVELDALTAQYPQAVAKHEALKRRNQIEALLRYIETEERNARSAYVADAVAAVTDYVRKKATPTTAEQKDAAVNLALQTAEAVASGAKDVPKNPIDTLFQEGFLAVEKQTQKAMAEPAILPENLDKAAMDLYTKIFGGPRTVDSYRAEVPAEVWSDLAPHLEPLVEKETQQFAKDVAAAKAHIEKRVASKATIFEL